MIVHRTTEQSTHFRASGCFCMAKDRLLMIQREKSKSFGLHWAVPTGKIEAGETARECMVRELAEEVGIRAPADALVHLSTSIVDDRGIVFEYTAFALMLDKRPRLSLERKEIERSEWVDVDQIGRRKVVPYFYNTLTDFLEWKDDGEVHWNFVPEPEAKSVVRRVGLGIRQSPAQIVEQCPSTNGLVVSDLFG